MRALLAVVTWLTLVARVPESNAVAAERSNEGFNDAEDDSDSAPFMIVVEHLAPDSALLWRCSGSLVSLRTGVTSAECARSTPGAMRELWALAAATAAGLASRSDGARRVSRIATTGAKHNQEVQGGEWPDDAFLDLAVLELESPFGSAAHTRPILMATAPDECTNSGVCHVVRSLETRVQHRARLRIVDATLSEGSTCAQRLQWWAAMRDRALCFTGPELCRPEWGAGVVCGGKLCGVVSRSAGGAAGGKEERYCGDTHAAQSVARWRRFLHCAHTLRACGRGSCAKLCSEQRLLDGSEESDSAEVTSSAEPELEHQHNQQQQLGEHAGGGREEERGELPEDSPPLPPTPHAHPADIDLAHIAPSTYPQLYTNAALYISKAVGAVLGQHMGEEELSEDISPLPPAPHAHPADIDLSHIVPSTYPPLYTNSTRVVPPTRVRPSALTQQTSRTLTPTFAHASYGRKPTRTSWPVTPQAAPLTVTVTDREDYDMTSLKSLMAIEVSSEAPSVETTVNKPKFRVSTTKPPSSTPLPPLTLATESSSVRPTPLFDPNRPDFRGGDYGDNAAEYAAPADDGGAGEKKTTGAGNCFENTTSTAAYTDATPRTAAVAQLRAADDTTTNTTNHTTTTTLAPEQTPRAQNPVRLNQGATKRNLAASNLHVHSCGLYLMSLLLFAFG